MKGVQFDKIKTRAFLREFSNKFIDLKKTKSFFNLDSSDTKRLLSELEKRGYIEKVRAISLWCVTIKGQLLQVKIFNRIFRRADIPLLIEEVIKRIEYANSNDNYLDRITAAYFYDVFSNENVEEVYRLTISVELERKEQDFDKYFELRALKVRDSDIVFSNIVEELGYPEWEILSFLKNSRHNLHIRNRNGMEDYEKSGEVKIYPV